MHFKLVTKQSFKALGCSAFAAILLGLASQANAQLSYSSNFDNDTPDIPLSGQDGWTDNDPNQPDGVGFTGYSGTGTDFVASVGGGFLPGGGPTVPVVYLSHGFTGVGATAYTFSTDFAITSSATTAFPNQDAFGINFRGPANALTNPTGNLFSIDFQPQTTTTTQDAIRYSTYNPVTGAFVAQNVTGIGAVLNSRYHLVISVNVTAQTLSITEQPEVKAGGALSGTAVTVANLPLSATLSGAVTNFAMTDTLAVAGSPGINSLFFDNLSVVPEPSTYAMLGLGLAGLAVRFRRKARA